MMVVRDIIMGQMESLRHIDIFFIMASTYNRKKKRKIINEDQGTRRELEQDVELIEKKK